MTNGGLSCSRSRSRSSRGGRAGEGLGLLQLAAKGVDPGAERSQRGDRRLGCLLSLASQPYRLLQRASTTLYATNPACAQRPGRQCREPPPPRSLRAKGAPPSQRVSVLTSHAAGPLN